MHDNSDRIDPASEALKILGKDADDLITSVHKYKEDVSWFIYPKLFIFRDINNKTNVGEFIL